MGIRSALTGQAGKPASQIAATNVRRGAKAAGSQRKVRAPQKACPAQQGRK